MIRLPAGNSDSIVCEEIRDIEQSLVQRLDRIEQCLRQAPNTFSFFEDALAAHRQRHLGQLAHHHKTIAMIMAKAFADSELSSPHHRLLQRLLDQYDHQEKRFCELHFSLLAKEARVGKSRAKCHLRLLEARGLIVRRADGYRVFYRVADSSDKHLNESTHHCSYERFE